MATQCSATWTFDTVWSVHGIPYDKSEISIVLAYSPPLRTNLIPLKLKLNACCMPKNHLLFHEHKGKRDHYAYLTSNTSKLKRDKRANTYCFLKPFITVIHADERF